MVKSVQVMSMGLYQINHGQKQGLHTVKRDQQETFFISYWVIAPNIFSWNGQHPPKSIVIPASESLQ